MNRMLLLCCLTGAGGLVLVWIGVRNVLTERARRGRFQYTGIGAVLSGAINMFVGGTVAYASVAMGWSGYQSDLRMKTREVINSAIQADDPERLQAILKSNAMASDPGMLDWCAQTAIRGGKPRSLAVLLKTGYPPETTEQLPLPLATELYAQDKPSSFEVIKVLVEGGVPIDVHAPGSGTPLSQAAYKGHVDVVEYLLQHGADYKLTDAACVGPLQMAAGQGHTSIVELLVKAGADINAHDGNGFTVLASAKKGGHGQTADWLRARGAHE